MARLNRRRGHKVGRYWPLKANNQPTVYRVRDGDVTGLVAIMQAKGCLLNQVPFYISGLAEAMGQMMAYHKCQ
eukprot:1146265-Amphidinium_carterae.1